MTSLWQLTDGKKFAQLIFSGENLIDCEFLKDGGQTAEDFVDKFIQDYIVIRHGWNSDFGTAKHHKYHESSNLNALNMSSNVTFINLMKLKQIPQHFLELMNLKKLQKKCNQLHKQIRQKLQNDEDTESDFDSLENTNGRWDEFDNLHSFDPLIHQTNFGCIYHLIFNF